MEMALSDAVGHDVEEKKLASFVERVEALDREKSEIAVQIREVFDEAKAQGFDVKVLKEVVRIRKQDAHKRAQHEALLDLYLQALGMTR